MKRKGIYYNKYICMIAWVQIAIQILLPLITLYSSETLAVQPDDKSQVIPYAQTMGTLASSISQNDPSGVKGTATGMATGAAASTVQEWLSHFGTAEVNLSVDDDGKWDNSSFDYLIPLYDNKKSVLFTQLGLRAPDGRTTGNIGMGVRTFNVERWMFGVNTFFDEDFTGKNRRVGFGAEAWTNYLKLTANTYAGTTDWHSSRDFNDYNEKPANGFDVRAEGYLPAYPQLGAKIMYEQYYGDKVALFDKDHLQNNPSAITTGFSYTPIPLVQLAVSYKRGQDSMDEMQFQTNFRYDFGRNWQYQIDPENVQIERSLAGSRYDLVERNNQIILQYKKKEQQGVSHLNLQITLDNSPSDGLTPNTAQVIATDKNGKPVRNAPIVWSTTGSAKFAASNTVTDDSGISTVSFTDTVTESISITAQSGAVTATQNSRFSDPIVSNIDLKITKDNSVADGKSANQALATVTDINGLPIANSKVTWNVTSPATLQSASLITDENGQAITGFTSNAAGTVTLTVSAGEKNATQQGHFTVNAASAVIDTLTVTRDGSPANGVSANTVEVTVKDNNGAPVSNANVTLKTDKTTVIFEKTAKSASGTVFQTDAQGMVSASFTDTVAETVQLTATLDNSYSKSVQASFVADSNSAKIQTLTTTSGAVANGVATNQATATVVDANNNPISGANVTWSQSGSAVLGATVNTDANGKTTITFTDNKAESVQITAKLASGSSLTQTSIFIADTTSVKISALDVTTGAIANGTATNQATVTVIDSNNNPVSGVDINWSQSGSATISNPAKSDENGKAVITLTDLKAETINVTAEVNGSTMSKPTQFIPDISTATVVLTKDPAAAHASDGVDKATLTATVRDKNNNTVSGFSLNWAMNGTYSSLSANSTTTDSNGQSIVYATNASYVDKTTTVNVSSQLPTTSTELLFASPIQSVQANFASSTGGIQTRLYAGGTFYIDTKFTKLGGGTLTIPASAFTVNLAGTSSQGVTLDAFTLFEPSHYRAPFYNITKTGELSATVSIGEYTANIASTPVDPSTLGAGSSTITFSPSRVAQGDAIVATLTAYDQYGNSGANIVGGLNLILSSSTGITAPAQFTQVNDTTWTATIQTGASTPVGNIKVTADPVNAGDSVSASFSITSLPVHAVATISPFFSGSATVGTPYRLLVTVKDSQTGAPLPGVEVKVQETSSLGVTISPDSGTTDGNGTFSGVYATGNVPGTATFTAEITGSTETQPSSNITFN